MGCVAPPLISPWPSHHFSDLGLLSVTFSPTQFCDALVTVGAPCLPRPSKRLARHRSRVWVGSNTPGHGAINLSPKSQSDGVCSASLISPWPSYHFSDVGLLSVTLGRLAEGGVCCSSLIPNLQKYKEVGYLPRINLKNSWVHEIAHPNHTL